jgi:tRNA (cmo5U34)-methyltransferase
VERSDGSDDRASSPSASGTSPLPKDSSVGHLPEGKWAFDESVARSFDDMLERSIPQYDLMRESCFSVAEPFIKQHGTILDIGCSRGEALSRFINRYGAHNRYLGLEISKPMLELARARFENYIKLGLVEIREHDLRTGYPAVVACVTNCVLTLQFTPIEYRQRILSDIYETTMPGGALVLVEKVLGDTARLDKVFVELYYRMKENNGYSHDEIERKRLSLEGVLVPVTARFNEELLRGAGFRQVDCFWRWMNFCGWVAVK